MIGINCCKDCTERYLGCHSNCEKYIAKKKEAEKIREKINNEQIINSIQISHYKRINKNKKPYKY